MRHPHPPIPREPRTDAEKAAYDAFIEADRATREERNRLENAVSAFKSHLTPQQLRAAIGDEVDVHFIAAHQKRFGCGMAGSGEHRPRALHPQAATGPDPAPAYSSARDEETRPFAHRPAAPW